jgi:nitrogen fixation-related uncharacterized protein
VLAGAVGYSEGDGQLFLWTFKLSQFDDMARGAVHCGKSRVEYFELAVF